MGKTLTNLAIPLKNKQSQDGTQHDFLGSFADKLDGFRDLLFEDHIESHGHENEGSRIIDSDYDQFITGTLAGIPSRSSERAHERISDKRKFADFMRSNDFEGLSEWLSQKGLNTAANEAVIAGALEVEKEVSTREGTDGDDVGKWNPLAVYRRVTDVERMQDALGHGFTDVLDVFPFQSASMIFVSPVFKWGVDKFDTLTEKIPISPVEKVVNDLGKYAGIAAFSSVADNLVGVREGYKFTEENPSIALIAGIQGGMLLPPGNMANVVEFPLNVYPLEEAKTQIGKIHARPLAEGFVWSQILGLADKAGIVSFPKPTDTEDHGSDIGETGSALPSSKTSRRDMLKSFFN